MAPPDEMGFTFIQQVQQKERRSHNITKIPADFFENLADHISHLRQLNRDEMARDPMSTTATLVQNELRNTLLMVQDIVHLRLGKMANRAVDSLRGSKVDLHSLTPREKQLYAELAILMANARDNLAPGETTPSISTGAPALATLDSAGTVAPKAPSADRPTMTSEERVSQAVDAPGPEEVAVTGETGGTGPNEETILLHVLSDLPSFVGEGGRNFALRKGDMVTMPQRLADVLIAKGIAEGIDPEKAEG